LRFKVSDSGEIKSTNIYIDGATVRNFPGSKGEVTFPVNEDKSISVGSHTLVVESVDESLNKTSKEVKFSVLAR